MNVCYADSKNCRRNVKIFSVHNLNFKILSLFDRAVISAGVS